MSEPLIARRLAIVPTTRCSLHCKLCGDFLNIVKRRDIPYEDVVRDIDDCFELFDRVEWLQFVGGELFVYDDTAKLLDYALKYKERFDKLIIETNATIAPNENEVRALLAYGEDVTIMISNYGELSYARDKFVEILEENNIDYLMKKYYGEDQYFNGWIDNTELRDLKEPEDVLTICARECPQTKIKNMHCYDGKLHRCANSCFMTEMGLFPPKKRDFVDLRDETVSIEEKRSILRDFYSYPRQSCRYCKQKYMAILPRYPAAEQIEKAIQKK